MLGYLKRLVTTGAAYQFGDILAKALALLTLPRELGAHPEDNEMILAGVGRFGP